MKKNLTFIYGGCRSGKTNFAISLAKRYNTVAYIATAQSRDQEMGDRIKKHRKTRPANWLTVEEPLNLATTLGKLSEKKIEVAVLDCLTLYLSNFIEAALMNLKNSLPTQPINNSTPQLPFTEENIRQEINKLITSINDLNYDLIIISNEVGLGIVPENSLARFYRDQSGWMNQAIAKKATTVYKMEVGIGVKIK
ncbi:MAG: bifunctional adenosylcobinamide kinase/adenosylcobinamide-phosphate guanylyltransferase [bacterium]